MIYIHPEIQQALAEKKAVVALESTLITHGFPRGENLAVARQVEEAVREAGALPATIAIMGERITVGLTAAELEELALAEGVRKCSPRDLPICVAKGEHGGTTVAGTMVIARRAGIRMFATGGIGGVHRGPAMDVSPDLIELGRTPVAVVCAGAKAILDLPNTLEVLETQGVPVIGYGTDEFPAFYSRHSGLGVDTRCDTPQEVAAILRRQIQLGLPGGALIVAPVPVDAEWPAAEAEEIISQALAAAEQQRLHGRALTPFLLAEVARLSGVKSKQANIALILNNARIAAAIALALAG
jgi:pseudouridylate synthase